MAVPKPSLTGGVKRVPWIALTCALVAIGYCAGLWFGGMSTFETLKVCIPSTDIEACIGAAESKVVLPDISLVIDLVGLLFGVIALWIAYSGLNTWKSELKHKRSLEVYSLISQEIRLSIIRVRSIGRIAEDFMSNDQETIDLAVEDMERLVFDLMGYTRNISNEVEDSAISHEVIDKLICQSKNITDLIFNQATDYMRTYSNAKSLGLGTEHAKTILQGKLEEMEGHLIEFKKTSKEILTSG